jgi:hypothetical protein
MKKPLQEDDGEHDLLRRILTQQNGKNFGITKCAKKNTNLEEKLSAHVV